MQTLQLPDGYQYVMPYLIIPNAAGFLQFVEKVFDGREKMKAINDDQTIMHGEVQIGDSTIMFADSNPQWGANTAGLYVHVTNVDETYRKALAEGAQSIIPPEDKHYGRTAGFKDPFGNTWWPTEVKAK